MDPEKKRQRIARYKEARARLDLLLAPEQVERFKAMPEFEGVPYPERLVALMDLWDKTHGRQPLKAKPIREKPRVQSPHLDDP